MKLASPQSVPEGVSSSAGMIVSTAALTKACSVGVSESQTSGSDDACVGAVAAAAAGAAADTPPANAAAVPSPAVFRKSRLGTSLPAIRASHWRSSFTLAGLRARFACLLADSLLIPPGVLAGGGKRPQ